MTTRGVFRGIFIAGILSSLTAPLWAADLLTTAVFAKTTSDYKRTRLENGSFKPEYYALSNGGTLPGSTRDPGMDEQMFPKIANAVGQSLARQKYFLARDSTSADLLLVVYWGKTIRFNDLQYRDSLGPAAQMASALAAEQGVRIADMSVEGQVALADFESYLTNIGMQNEIRRRQLLGTARIIGYVQDLDPLQAEGRFGIREDLARQLEADVEEERYYVVVMAFDFKQTIKKTPKMLWVTRISIRAEKTNFEEGLSAMLASASRHLGQNTGRLIRGLEPGRVEIGEATVIGVVPDVPPPTDGKK